MPKDLSRRALRASFGFIVGLALWAGLSVPYTRVIGCLAETVLRVTERPAVTRLQADGTLLIVDRRDVLTSPSAGRFAVESTELTFNVIVLLTLFAVAKQPFGDRNVFGLAAAASALVVVHVAAVISFVEAYYVTSGDAPGSSVQYGFFARHFWPAAPYFYSVVGVYGAAVALWWVCRPPDQVATDESRHARSARGQTKAAASRRTQRPSASA